MGVAQSVAETNVIAFFTVRWNFLPQGRAPTARGGIAAGASSRPGDDSRNRLRALPSPRGAPENGIKALAAGRNRNKLVVTSR